MAERTPLLARRKIRIIGSLMAAVILVAWFCWPQIVLRKEIVKGAPGKAAPLAASAIPQQAAAVEVETALQRAGQLGDSYGALTSLLTAIGTLGLLVTLLYLRDQVDEARRATEYAKQAADAAEEQTKLARKSFEAEHEARQRESNDRAAADATERRFRQAETAERQFFQLLSLLQSHASGLKRNPLFGMAAVRNLAHSVLTSSDSIIGATPNFQDAWIRISALVSSNVGDEWAHLNPFLDTLDVLVAVVARKDLSNGRELCGHLCASLGPEVVAFACVHACVRHVDSPSLMPWKNFVEMGDVRLTVGGRVFGHVLGQLRAAR